MVWKLLQVCITTWNIFSWWWF